ncbi:hypothetical protein L226DRAFT_566266 [Lentinus tigrinus ALCF2SS1-7]|uniref:Uncharacterized protein n=1 Tax=Lentinus tigrinus ALCF2SS1-6 TaxID=1328759 RepID=A0A5C2RLG7_9APHY|nr:hypothetical protein L227DRAFT_617816 [Lentinus tigrinus ALCF2SS1-6]RPD79687.1 hypothetical protein L226DRAFT_566266 [Lentinus tigrinus ALCF2SS1-7]
MPARPTSKSFMANDYPSDPEADIYLLADTWTSAAGVAHETLALVVNSQDCDEQITLLLPTGDNAHALSWISSQGMVSIVQSTQMTRTGIFDDQRSWLLNIALVYLAFATPHPNLQPQDLVLFTGALV